MPNESISKGQPQTKICQNCLLEKPVAKFKKRITKNGFSYSPKCAACYGVWARRNKPKKYQIRRPYETKDGWFKVCSKCNIAKKLIEFSKSGKKGFGFGTASICLICTRKPKPPFVILSFADYRICNCCKIEKQLIEFHYKRRVGFGFGKKCHKCAYLVSKSRERRKGRKEIVPAMPHQIGAEWFKVCTKCKSAKQITEFYKNNKSKSGVSSSCKTCLSNLTPKQPKIRLTFQDPQICKDCGVIKPLSNFGQRNHKDGTIGYDQKCRTCRSRPYAAKARKKRKEKLALSPKLKELHRQKVADAASRRRAIEQAAPIVIKFSRADLIKRDGLNCYLCSKTLTEKQVVLEHLIPLCRGGNHKPENVKIACRRCNSKKFTKTVTEYKKWRGDYDRFKKSAISSNVYL